MIRFEDVDPDSDPAQLRRIADYLHSRNVPFAVAVFLVYDDAKSVYSGGVRYRTLSESPQVVAALRDMTDHGGTLIMPGTPGHLGVPALRGQHFNGILTGTGTRSVSQFFPNVVKGAYGTPVIPESLGNVATQRFNQHGVQLVPDLPASRETPAGPPRQHGELLLLPVPGTTIRTAVD
ncbi:DUF2334 domain-containing protein [Dactylosporangium darangshiense]|uniref:DUF2334 domain-containing protein n=1 Tax=Dactylosporangium darangshiense TaxID=579108 RepID=UPI0031EB16BA